MPRPTGANSSSETTTSAFPTATVNQLNPKQLKRPSPARGFTRGPLGNRSNVGHMPSSTLAEFLLPEGFAAPRVAAVLREGSAVMELGRFAVRAAGAGRTRRATPYAVRGGAVRGGDPVLLVPGFLAGDGTLALMARVLRSEGLRTYRSHIHANVGCTQDAAA